MPFLDELDLLLAFLPHALPFDQLPALCLLFDPIAHGRYHHHQPEKARRRDLVLVQRHRERDANKNARGHDNGEDDGAKILDGVEDEELSDSGAYREEEEVDLNLGVAADEGEVLEPAVEQEAGGHGKRGSDLSAEQYIAGYRGQAEERKGNDALPKPIQQQAGDDPAVEQDGTNPAASRPR